MPHVPFLTFPFWRYNATVHNNQNNKLFASFPVTLLLCHMLIYSHCGKPAKTHPRRLQLYQPPAPCYIITHYGKKTIPQPIPLRALRAPPRQPPIRIRGGDRPRAFPILPPTLTIPRGRPDAPRRPLPHCGCLHIAPRCLLLRPSSLRPHL